MPARAHVSSYLPNAHPWALPRGSAHASTIPMTAHGLWRRVAVGAEYAPPTVCLFVQSYLQNYRPEPVLRASGEVLPAPRRWHSDPDLRASGRCCGALFSQELSPRVPAKIHHVSTSGWHSEPDLRARAEVLSAPRGRNSGVRNPTAPCENQSWCY